jgi:hypothetical protein
MSSPLEKLCGPNQPLRQERPDAQELEGLIRSATERLADARRPVNSLSSRFDLAYNAAHAFCLAALRRAGFRPANRYIVFQALPHSLGLGPEVWKVLAKCHDIRNRGEYEGLLEISERLLADLILATDKVAQALAAVTPGPDSP